MNHTNPFESSLSVLVIKLRAIGDVLLSTPVVENLKRQFPHLKIDFLCEQFAADVVRGNPNINDVITFNKKKESALSLIQKIREKKYDVVVDLFGNPRSALVTKLSGASCRIGFPFRGRRYAYTDYVTPRGGEVHNVDFNLDVLRHFHIPIVSSHPYFPYSEEELTFAQQWTSENELNDSKIIGINPSGGWYTKRWPKEKFALLADNLAVELQAKIILFWGPGEHEDVKKIQSLMKQSSIVIPSTTLKQMGALLKQCSYLVSNDSGPMHIAASLGVPALGIFGPTNPFLQGPYGGKSAWIRNESLDCLACNLTKCPIGNVCMSDLSVESVLTAFHNLIKSN
ncbi:MAG: glycosyltransferase family 9 protein [Bacteroidota bacterium]|nr:glycosyltransferase family 9 protein [Bacteroidota bacterium]